MKKHNQTQVEWENQMAYKILELIRNELYLDMPYLSIALNSLEFKADDQIETLATDANTLFFNAQKIIDLFKKNPRYINRAYLHSIFHCLFSHLWIRQDKEENLWNIACDICVEYTIDHLNKTSTKRILSLLRKETYRRLEKEIKGISSAAIYYWLQDQNNLSILQREFYTDDHRYWPKQDNSRKSPLPNNVQNQWQKIARQTALEQKRKGKDNQDESSQIITRQMQAEKNRRSYKDFLEKFSIIQEEVQVNPDEFDLSYYTYGLTLYKNLPLIEAIETKEVKKIQEFAIVIDTSYSTNGSLVKNFLKETYTMLSQRDSFFKKSTVHIIQCDNQVQKDDVITNEREMDALLHNFTLVGNGTTDFRPAFIYVDELINEGRIKRLSSLLYFTDGKGIYPKRRPAYKCAFIFLEDYDKTKIPPWAITYQLDPIELERKDIDNEHQRS